MNAQDKVARRAAWREWRKITRRIRDNRAAIRALSGIDTPEARAELRWRRDEQQSMGRERHAAMRQYSPSTPS